MEAELSLIDKVELRITLSSSDSKFEQNLSAFLAPLIHKLSSPYPEVQIKVLKFIKHLLIRIDSISSLKLPVVKLLEQAKQPAGFSIDKADSFDQVKLYSYFLAIKGLEREKDEFSRLELLPLLLQCLGAQLNCQRHEVNVYGDKVLARWYALFVKVLDSFSESTMRSLQEPQKYFVGKEKIPFKNSTDFTTSFLQVTDVQPFSSLLELFSKFFSLLPKQDSAVKSYHCPGLTSEEVEFFTYHSGASYTSSQLNSIRMKILHFIQLVDFKALDFNFYPYLYFVFFFGKRNPYHDVKSLSSTLMSRIVEPRFSEFKLADDVLELAIDYFCGTPTRASVLPAAQEELIRKVFIRSEKIKLNANEIVLKITLKAIDTNSIPQPHTVKLMEAGYLLCSDIMKHSSTGPSRSDFVLQLVPTIIQNIKSNGWFKQEVYRTAKDYSILRSLQYSVLADLLSYTPSLLIQPQEEGGSMLMYFMFFFDALQNEARNIIPDVRKSLGRLIDKFADEHRKIIDTPFKDQVETLLKDHFRSVLARDLDDVPSDVKIMALRFVNKLFSYADPESRFMNLYGLTQLGLEFEVTTESQRGLNPFWFQEDFLREHNVNEIIFPTFEALIDQYKKELEYLNKYPNSGLLVKVLVPVYEYILKILFIQCVKGTKYGASVFIDKEWDFQTSLVDVDSRSHNIVIRSLGEGLSVNRQHLSFFAQSLLDCFVGNSLLTSNSQYAMVGDLLTNDGVSDIPVNLYNIVYDNVAKYGPILYSLISVMSTNYIADLKYTRGEAISSRHLLLNLVDMREHGLTKHNKTYFERLIKSGENVSSSTLSVLANNIAILTSVGNDQVDDLLKSLMYDMSNTSSYNIIHFIVGAHIIAKSTVTNAISSEYMTKTFPEFFKTYIDLLSENYKSKSWPAFSALLLGLNEMCKYGTLNSVASFMPGVRDLIKDRIKIDENCVMSWSYLSLVPSEPDDVEQYISTIYETHTAVKKHSDYLFATGEALSVIGAGWKSQALSKLLDIQQGPEVLAKLQENTDVSRLEKVLANVIKGCANTKPVLRKAACVWLLSLVQFCGHLDPVKSKAKEIQLSFMKFLASSDELVQESASTGLGLIYETGDADLKESLVKGLMKSFTSSITATKLSAGTIDHDTELFETGVLNTRDGSVSTYKDILNLANDVGDPSLVYKFMSLTRNSNLWASRKGLAFGLGNVVSKSRLSQMLAENDQLATKLVVKLYRYRFDPNANVARSMNQIWDILVPGGDKIVVKDYDAIITDLFLAVGSREWRTREAAIKAMDNLIRSVSTELYEKYLERIWDMAFRAMDDIKDSVRESGTALTKYLSSNLLNSVSGPESGSKKVLQRIMAKLIPLFTGPKGISSSVEEIRSFSLKIILDLCQKAGPMLVPFIPQLIEDMLVLMSTLEPQIANYVSLNAANYNVSAADIDAHRVTNVGSSPMMSATEKMLDLVVDDDVVDSTVAKINSAIKKSVGLPSKAAGSKLIVSLVVKHMSLLKPTHGSSLLKTCISQLNDRNETVAQAYAYAAGHVCRVVKLPTMIKYATKLNAMYFAANNTAEKKVVATACRAVSRSAPANFSAVAQKFLPLAYIAQNDPDSGVAAEFAAVWLDNTGASGAVKLYIDDICEIVSQHMDSPSYVVRGICGKSLAKACSQMTVDGEKALVLGDKSLNTLFEMLLATCKGRFWKGKQTVVESLVILSGSIAENGEIRVMGKNRYTEVEKIVISEAKRPSRNYQVDFLKILSLFIKKFPKESLYLEEIKLMGPFFEDSFYEKSNSEDEDDEENTESATKKLKTTFSKSSETNLKREAVYISLLNAIADSFTVTEEVPETLISFMFGIAIPYVFSSAHMTATWRSKLAVCESIGKILDNLKDRKLEKVKLDKVYLIVKDQCLWFNDVENVKIQGIRVLGKMIKSTDNEEFLMSVKKDLVNYRKRESSSVILNELEKIS